jgi:hypothetical protein
VTIDVVGVLRGIVSYRNLHLSFIAKVLPDDMAALRKSLLNMENRDIGCGPVGAEVSTSIFMSLQF